MTRADAARRLHPHVNVIGHPTGAAARAKARNYDFEAVFNEAARHSRALEIDCDPARMDLSPEMAHWRSSSVAISRSTPTPTRRPSSPTSRWGSGWRAERASRRNASSTSWMWTR